MRTKVKIQNSDYYSANMVLFFNISWFVTCRSFIQSIVKQTLSIYIWLYLSRGPLCH